MSDTNDGAPDLLAERDRLRAVNAELVAALRGTLANFPRYNRDQWPELANAHDTARAAIAKATGDAT